MAEEKGSTSHTASEAHSSSDARPVGGGEDQGASMGSWWSSWVNTAREKSMSALSATKRDLAEFMTVVHRDTVHAVSGAATSISGMVNSSSTQPQEKGEQQSDGIREKVEPDGPSGLMGYDRSVTQLHMLRTCADTYCTIPDGHAAQFLEWSRTFDLPASQDAISHLLVDSPDVRQLHAELVPVKVSYEAFWHHYFYRVHLLEQEHAHRAAIMARAGSQGKLINWEEEEEEEEEEEAVVIDQSNEHVINRSASSDSFICINDTTPVDTEKLLQQSHEEITADDIGGGGGGDNDSDWERWSD